MARQKAATPSVLKPKTCVKKIRVNGEHVPCGKQYVGDERNCPNREIHLLPFKSGFCGSGFCEGTKPKAYGGIPAKTCTFIATCLCKCHDMMDKMFFMSEMERIVVENPEYQPPVRTFWLPSDDPDFLISRATDTDTPVYVESPAPDLVPATVTRTFAPTPSGRAARGELELWVKQACDVWLIDQPGTPCTPTYIAEDIAHDQGIIPPSVGAITSVFNRWSELGFAVIDKKPTRFTSYTPEGVEKGLDLMKIEAKRKKKFQLADDKRNLRR